MFVYEKSSSIGHFSVLAVLWLVNILIVVFGVPFLLYKKTQEIYLKIAKKPSPEADRAAKPASYFPCRN